LFTLAMDTVLFCVFVSSVAVIGTVLIGG
jgi:hypothetical protein